MMEVGFSEILLISVLALIVLGPEKLPKVAAEIGRWVGRARSMARQFRDQLEDEASLEPSIHKKRPATASADTAAPVAAAPAVGAETPVVSTPAESAPSGEFTSTEITPDAAELTPHAPLEYTPPIEDYVASHAAATPDDLPHEERTPRL